MTETYPDLRVEWTYGQWVAGRSEAAEDGALQPVVADMLAGYFARHHLVPIEEPRYQHVAANQHGFKSGDFVAVIAEARAAGLPPEQRLPQGWRRWFCAP